MAISYAKFKRTFGDLGITEWVKFNWLSNAGIGRKIYNKVIEAEYNPLAYVNDELYNRITKTINIWDEEWEAGYFDLTTGEPISNSSISRSKNFIKVLPATKYFYKSNNVSHTILYYDANGNYISNTQHGSSNSIFITPQNCYFIKIAWVGTTYNHDICINVSDPYINGNYFPYFEGEKFLVLVNRVDLETLRWTYHTNNRFSATVPNDLKPVSDGSQPNWRCNTYVPMSNNISLDTQQDGICYVNTSFYTYSASAVAPNPTGLLDYEVNTPVLIDLN